jgi:hypothetical protein
MPVATDDASAAMRLQSFLIAVCLMQEQLAGKPARSEHAGVTSLT